MRDRFIVWAANCLLRLASKKYRNRLTRMIALGKAAYEDELRWQALEREYRHLSEALNANENP